LLVFIDSDEPELKKLLRQVDDMRFLIFENDYFKGISSAELYKQLNENLSVSGFQDLIRINNNGEQVVFKLIEYNGIVHELIMIALSADELIFMNLSGKIDLDKINILAESIDINNAHGFYK
jgi:hypothetical protein